MQWKRVKTILLFILLFGNMLLGLQLVYSTYEAWVRSRENLTNVQNVLARYNTTLADDFTMPKDLTMPLLHVERRRADEEAFAVAVLTDAYLINEDETKVYFEGDMGYLNWSTDGLLEGVIVRPDADPKKSIKKQAEELYTSWRLDLTDVQVTEISQDTVEMTSHVAGLPVFNRHMTLFFSDTEIRITGWWSFAAPYALTKEPDLLCNASDALLHFASNQTHPLGTIEDMTLGYCLQPNRGRMQKLVPAWQIETAQEIYFVDATGNEIISEETE